MVASEVRLNARKALTGKWGKSALITLVYALTIFVITLVLGFIPVIGVLIAIAITVPLGYGIIVTFMDLKREEDTTYTQFFSNGFNSFAMVWKVTFRIILKLIVPILLVFLSYVILVIGLGSTIYGTYGTATLSSSYASSVASFGAILILVGFVALFASMMYCVVKYYLYYLSFNVLRDNPNMTAKEVVEESARLMNGNRWSFFWLQLTFIGWAILATISFGIGYLWLIPYVLVAQVEFYEQLAGKTSKEEKVEASIDEDDGNAIKEM